MIDSHHDAIVVGSGFGGAVAACRLAQAGLRVLLLERGRRYNPGDFPRGLRNLTRRGLWQRKQGLFDIRTFPSMTIVQAAGYGGGSLVYANVQTRAPADAFASGWPKGYSRDALNPYYDLVAYMLDIKPVSADQPMGLPQRSGPLGIAAKRLARRGQYRSLNLAVNFAEPGVAVRNRFGVPQQGCDHCAECCLGCNSGAKNSLNLNYLAQAEQLGTTVGTQCEVVGVAPHGSGYQVSYIDHRWGGATKRAVAPRVFLCAGTLNTTELLLRCRDVQRTLPNVSEALGSRYSANGDAIAFAFKTAAPYLPNQGPTITTGLLHDRGKGEQRTWFMFQDGGYPRGMGTFLDAVLQPQLAKRLRRWVKRCPLPVNAGEHSAPLLAMGRDRSNGHLTLQRRRQALRIHWDRGSNMALYRAQERLLNDVATSLGGRMEPQPLWRWLGRPVSVHNLGGCIMADSPQAGVVDAHGEVFGYPNLYVLDGAALPAAVGVNPSHTIAAVAERNVEAAIRRMAGKGEWSAPERQMAPQRVEPLDTAIIPHSGTPEPVTAAGSVVFTETMRGHCVRGVHDYQAGEVRGAQGRGAVEFTLTIALPDLDGFSRDKGHTGQAEGIVHVAGLTDVGGAAVREGTFELFARTSGKRRRMTYTLPFVAADGQRYVLHGFKDVRNDGSFNVWQATSTLYATIFADDVGGPLYASGILRIRARDFVRQLGTLHVRGTDRWHQQLTTLTRFAGMFADNLWQTFVR